MGVIMIMLSLYVGFIYSIMTVLAIVTSKDSKDTLMSLLVLLPPAFLGLLVFAMEVTR